MNAHFYALFKSYYINMNKYQQKQPAEAYQANVATAINPANSMQDLDRVVSVPIFPNIELWKRMRINSFRDLFSHWPSEQEQ